MGGSLADRGRPRPVTQRAQSATRTSDTYPPCLLWS